MVALPGASLYKLVVFYIRKQICIDFQAQLAPS